MNNCYLFVSHLIASQHGSGEEAHSVSTRHALIMDEVDGMAGSEDRGGIQVMKALYFAVILLLFNCFVFKCKELIIMLAYLWQCC